MKVSNTWDGIIELEIAAQTSNFHHSYQVTIPDIFDSKSTILKNHDPNLILEVALENCPLDKSRIIGLRVQNLPISEIPSNIIEFNSLQRVKFIRNKFSHFPNSLIGLINLEEITIFNSSIKSIPPEIVRLTQLKHLNLFQSKLPELPDHLMELDKLEYLGISGANLSQIPPDIRHLKNLRKLDLYKNQLETLPEQITELSRLEVLWLHGNSFTSAENLRIKNLLPKVNVITGKPTGEDKIIANNQ